jgi:hypothetical protein
LLCVQLQNVTRETKQDQTRPGTSNLSCWVQWVGVKACRPTALLAGSNMPCSTTPSISQLL